MKILHLEDSVNDACLVEDLLLTEWPEARITRVERRDEFITAIEHGDFILILSDHALGDFDGSAALELARARCPETPFIFLSGTIGEERAIEALHRGAADYVIKDRPARLIPAVRQALARAEETIRRQRAEIALRESQLRFQQLADQSSEIFWFASLEPEQVIYVSPAVERIWGLPVERFYADPHLWLASVHPEDRPRVSAAYDAWIKGVLSGFDEEFRVIRPDGTFSWVIDSGTLIRDRDGRAYRVSGIAKDVTARRVAEAQLREQAALLDKARDGILLIDFSHRISYWNASAERIYGWKATEIFGKRLEDLNFGYNPEQFASAEAQVRESGEWRGEYSLRNKLGAELKIESTWSLVRDAEGELCSILMIDTDVTERRRLESQLLRADRIDSIGMLAGGIAHDINNALAPILIGAELLRSSSLDPRNLRLVESIERSAQHGAALVRQLLAFARGEGGERSSIRVKEVVGDVNQLLRQTLARSIELVTDCTGATQTILADSTQIKQILINLAVNARDAMPHGGRLMILATDCMVDEDLARRFPGGKAGPHVRVSVTDTGTGIPPAVLDRIFDPFFTTKGIGKGTGLGLSTVLGIMKSHGGIMRVESEVGKGTTFHLFFPAELQAEAPTMLSANPFTAEGHSELVLVVDDEEAIRFTLRLGLEHAGYRVAVAADAEDGLVEFERHPDKIAVVITDLRMPGMSGLDFIAALRVRRPQQCILAMSGFVDSKEQAALQSLQPAVGFFAKPTSIENLLVKISQVVSTTRSNPLPNVAVGLDGASSKAARK